MRKPSLLAVVAAALLLSACGKSPVAPSADEDENCRSGWILAGRTCE